MHKDLLQKKKNPQKKKGEKNTTDALQKLVIEHKRKRQFHLELNRRSSIRRSQCRDKRPCIRSRAPHRNPSSRLGVVFFCTEKKMPAVKLSIRLGGQFLVESGTSSFAI